MVPDDLVFDSRVLATPICPRRISFKPREDCKPLQVPVGKTAEKSKGVQSAAEAPESAVIYTHVLECTSQIERRAANMLQNISESWHWPESSAQGPPV